MLQLTIIIPHHNIPELLDRCLDSIPEDDDIQVIVVDDNSSTDIVDFSSFPGCSRENVKIIFDKVGGGAGHARNVGLGFVKSKWVCFADADDFFSDGAFTEIRKYFSSNSDLVLFKVRSVNTDTLVEQNRSGVGINYAIDKYLAGNIEPRMVAFCNEAPWAKLISYELIKSKGYLFDEIRFANDIMFSTKVSCAAKRIEISNFHLYTLTVRNGSLSFSSNVDSANFLARMDVRSRRNLLLKQYGFRQPYLGIYLLDANRIGKPTLKSCYKLLIERGQVTDGLFYYLLNLLKIKD